MTETQNPQPQVLLQKIFLRDASCEVPKAPEIFTKAWKPEMDVQLNTATKGLGGESHLVELTVTVTAKLEEQTAFLVEVKQAGIFDIKGIADDAQLKAVLGGYCPGILFPYLRESVSDLVQRAGFPQMLLQPMNFEALYHQHAQAQGQAPDAAAAAAKTKETAH